MKNRILILVLILNNNKIINKLFSNEKEMLVMFGYLNVWESDWKQYNIKTKNFTQISIGIKLALEKEIDFSIYSKKQFSEFNKWRKKNYKLKNYKSLNDKNLEIFGYLNVFEAGWKKLGLKLEDLDNISIGIKKALDDKYRFKYSNNKLNKFGNWINRNEIKISQHLAQ